MREEGRLSVRTPNVGDVCEGWEKEMEKSGEFDAMSILRSEADQLLQLKSGNMFM